MILFIPYRNFILKPLISSTKSCITPLITIADESAPIMEELLCIAYSSVLYRSRTSKHLASAAALTANLARFLQLWPLQLLQTSSNWVKVSCTASWFRSLFSESSRTSPNDLALVASLPPFRALITELSCKSEL